MIRIKNVSVYYQTVQGTVKAIEDVSFEIFDNEIIGIAGESGCGKSTLMKAIYGNVEPPMYHRQRLHRDGSRRIWRDKDHPKPGDSPLLVGLSLLHPAGIDERVESGGAHQEPVSGFVSAIERSTRWANRALLGQHGRLSTGTGTAARGVERLSRTS